MLKLFYVGWNKNFKKTYETANFPFFLYIGFCGIVSYLFSQHDSGVAQLCIFHSPKRVETDAK